MLAQWVKKVHVQILHAVHRHSLLYGMIKSTSLHLTLGKQFLRLSAAFGTFCFYFNVLVARVMSLDIEAL